MITHFKSALDQVKAEDELISKTEVYLKDALEKNQNNRSSEFKRWGLSKIKMKKLAIAACMAIVLIGGSGGAYAYYQTPVKYLSLDINPSVELGVNAFDKVVQAEGYNEDGKLILNGTDVIGSDVTEAVSALVSSAADNGFVAEDGSTVISLTSETDDAAAATEIEAAAVAGAEEALKENGDSAAVIKDNVALARRDEARALGITPGKLNLINKLKAVDSTATVEQYKDASVKEIMKTINANRKGTAVTNSETTTGTTTGTAAEGTSSGTAENTSSSQGGTAVTSTTQTTVNNASEAAVETSKNKENGNVNNIVENNGNSNKADSSKDKEKGNANAGSKGQSNKKGN